MKKSAFALLLALIFTGPALAQYSKQDRKEMEKMVKGIFYLRTNVPYNAYDGLAITQISPTEIDWDRGLEALARIGGLKPQPVADLSLPGMLLGIPMINTTVLERVYWGFGPNSAISNSYLEFPKEPSSIHFWAKGIRPHNSDVGIDFIQIKSLDDFKKAFDLILSNKPLQDEHPEWPEEIRKAIASRVVIEGMSKEQAFIVLGAPLKVEKGEKDGRKIETWYPIQTDFGFQKHRATSQMSGMVQYGETGFPESVQFVDGKLSSITKRNYGPVKVDIKISELNPVCNQKFG